MKKIILIALIFVATDVAAQRSNRRYRNNRNNYDSSYRYQNPASNGTYQSRSGNFYTATTLIKDYHYTSPNSQYFYQFQADGNLVVYRTAGLQPIWASGTQGRAVKAVFQNDGNLVLTDVNGGIVWDAFALAHQTGKGVAENAAQHRSRGNRNAIVMQDDGNLVIYAGNGTTARWHSGSNQ